MNFKNIIVLLLLFLSFQLKAQKADTIPPNSSHLIFQLKILSVLDVKTKEVLTNVKLKIIGTDASSREFISDSLGVFPKIYLDPNTSYSTVVEKANYLNAKGKETTVGSLKSKVFVHEYEMQKMTVCGGSWIPKLYFEKNKTKPFIIDEYALGFSMVEGVDLFYTLMGDNPTLIIQFIGYRDASEKKTISLKRAKQFAAKLVELGIDKERLIVVDGGVSNYILHDSDKRELSAEELKQENRRLTFKFLSTDSEPK